MRQGHADDSRATRLFDVGQFGSCTSWFDLFGRCCNLVDEAFPDHGELVEMYCSPAHSGGRSNPNLPALINLENSVADLAVRFWENPVKPVSSDNESPLQTTIGRALGLVGELQPYRRGDLNAMTPWFFVARGIDRAAVQQKALCSDEPGEVAREKRRVRQSSSMRDRCERQVSHGPLNGDIGEGNHRFAVYQNPGCNLIERISLENGLARIPDCSLNDQFQKLMYYAPHSKFAPLPDIVMLPRPKRWAPPTGENPLKIGVVPFSRASVIGVDGSGEPARIVPGDGNSFTIEYLDGYAELFEGRVIAAIDEAIDRECHIVVLPELVMPDCLVEAVRRHLRGLRGEHTLALVVAGSGWVVEGSGKCRHDSNVCNLIDAYGMPAGVHHKQKRFHYSISRDKWPYYADNPSSSPSPGNAAPETVTLVEGFTNSDAESTFVIVPDFGLVLPMVCMDLISDDAYAASLARFFRPQLICCPALSSSLDRGFSLPSQQMVERFLSAVCICDLCGSRSGCGGGSVSVGIAGAPGFYAAEAKQGGDMARRPKSKKQPAFVAKELFRTQSCEKQCRSSSEIGCLFVVNVDYSAVSPDGIKPSINPEGPLTYSCGRI